MKINFRCYECRKLHYTKQNLSEYECHLICQECFGKKPPVDIPFFKVVYLTKRGLEKTTTLRLDTEKESREYILTKKHVKSIVSVEQV